MRKYIFCFLVLIFISNFSFAQNNNKKKILVLVEGDYNLKSIPTAEGRELQQLLGHFKTNVTISGINSYKIGEVEKYDYVFYVGYTPSYKVSTAFCHDIVNTSKTVVWINSGFEEFSKRPEVLKKYGFSVSGIESSGEFNTVKDGNAEYTKGSPNINLIKIVDKKSVEVWSTAISSRHKKETPYMVKSSNLIYVADLPFIAATETDRYLLFADRLHDILNENHATQHQAIIRIEDVNALSDPNKLREIADIFAEKGIPFLVGVVPIYVNPVEDRRVALSERPEVVDALKYMVHNGGSIIMHGVTHQYTGISTDDCEFWDGIKAKPIADEDTNDIAKRLELGIDEFFKNGLYPIAWETPHYEASIKSYETFSKFFSTCVEQRMVINNFDYGQYFPYTIDNDIYNQKIYPENLGYIPLNSNIDSSRVSVNRILKNAATIHQTRDGIVSFFFHPFLDLELLKELVDGIKSQGFKFININNGKNWTKSHDKIILTGSQAFKLNIPDLYLHEAYFDNEGNLIRKSDSPNRISGIFSKSIMLNPGGSYIAEAIDYHVKELSFMDKVVHGIKDSYTNMFGNKDWKEARVKIIWNQSAKGAAFYDQSSLAAIFKSVNINVDTIFLGQDLNLYNCNLLVVPYSSVDSLTYFDYDKIVRFVKKGGNLITDRKNKLITNFGIKFLNSDTKVHLVRDKYFPQEYISWKYSQLAIRFEYDDATEVLCEDAASGFPVVIGKSFGKGKLLYFNTAFDPYSPIGYSNYPYALEYVNRYLGIRPVIKRENLEFYFDPGFRRNISEESIVKIWVKQGIRIIHVGGWHQYQKYTYDYKRLIKLAHANGILVYAWIEPPYVSEKFWQNHPEWREKNFKDKDINRNKDTATSWRLPMALTDPKCLNAVISEYTKFLQDYDWDGVNIAELYFEGGAGGFNDEELFAPMHPSAREEFKKKYGFDLKLIFDPNSSYYWKFNPKAKEDVVNYRIDKIISLHERILKAIYEVAKNKNGMGVMVTTLDTYFSPELKEISGISSDKIIDLQNKYGFLLQAEDPLNKWSTDPSRYEAFGKFYASKMNDPSKLLVDLNILSFRSKEEVTPFPTLMQTGIESYQLINSAALGAPRFTVYSEGSCYPQDLNFFSYASSSMVKYKFTEKGYEVNSPYSFILQLPSEIKVISIDDVSVIGYRDNRFIVPAGKHSISLHTDEFAGFSTVELQPQLLSFTGNLLEINYSMRQVNFKYESFERAFVSINRMPTSVKIDNKDTEFKVLNGEDCFTLSLPAGKHSVEIITGDELSYDINVTSLWSINAIAIYGSTAVILLIFMYLFLKLMRKRLER